MDECMTMDPAKADSRLDEAEFEREQQQQLEELLRLQAQCEQEQAEHSRSKPLSVVMSEMLQALLKSKGLHYRPHHREQH